MNSSERCLDSGGISWQRHFSFFTHEKYCNIYFKIDTTYTIALSTLHLQIKYVLLVGQ